MFRATCLALLSYAIAAAQGPDLARAVKDPYLLADWIEAHPDLVWSDVAQALHIKPFQTPSCGAWNAAPYACAVEILAAQNPDQVILVATNDQRPDDVFLRYLKQGDGSWRFADLNFTENWNHPRAHKLETCKEKPFLIVSGQGTRGSGVDSEIQTLYDLSGPKFEPVFAIVSAAWLAPNPTGITRDIRTSFELQSPLHLEVKMRIDFFLASTYKLSGIDIHATYARDQTGKPFEFRSASRTPGSTPVSRATIDKIAGVDDGPSAQALVRYVMPGLRELATGTNSDAKEALGSLLSTLGDTAATREIERLLHQRRLRLTP